ncbi:phage baseplate upper protein [Enterococcus faecium]|uniref:phage baseplate upper protein n=1 Tax=Enterococcus faecium TaxID=1352 RepID=UPI0021AEA659|nr:phage baseplate upper protein [Enterococcus faecium]
MAHVIKKGSIKVPTQPKDYDLQATGLVFKSYDNQIALEFNVEQQNGTPADLLGANLRLLMFIYDEVDGMITKEPIPFITKNLITESFLNGQVVYILPEAMKAYNGMVEAYVYIEYPDGSTSDNLGFTFRMKRSAIDGLAQDKADYFIADFQQLLDGVKQEATDAVNEALAKVEASSTAKMQELEAVLDAEAKRLTEHANQNNQKITEYDQKFQQTAQNIATLDQNFLALQSTMKLSAAWAWSKDGTDRFTTVYPGENYVLKSKDGYTAAGNGGSNQYPAAINSIPLNPDILGKDATIQYKLTISNYESGSFVVLKLYNAVGVWASFGGNSMISGNGTWLIQWKGTLPPLKENGLSKVDFNTNLKADILIEELQIKEGTEYQIYTPAPSEDYANAYPTYKGISIVDSNNPNDYSWDITPEYAEKGLNDTVSLTEPQSVEGLKNFEDGLQLKGISVVQDNFTSKAVTTKNITDFTEDSIVRFERWGRLVIANIEIINKSANFAGWKNLMAFPSGYTPISLVGWGGTLSNKTNRNPALSVYANDSGISVMISSADLPANQRCSGTVAYFTNDKWPQD